MKETLDFLRNCGTFYLATNDTVDDGLMTVFKFVDGTATICSFTEKPVIDTL